MGFKHGNTGRPKGAINKTTAQLREFLSGVLENNQEKFTKTLQKLDPKDFAKIFLETMQYTLPKLKQIELKDQTTISAFLAMTPKERIELYARLEAEKKESESQKK